jgi:hypothetical protein
MMTKAEPLSSPSWLYYFSVETIGAAADRVRDKGGQVHHGPLQIPGGNWIVKCEDPQGARFALIGARR